MAANTPLASLVTLALTLVSAPSMAAVTFGDTELTFGGYVKLDMMWSDTSDGQIATGIGRDFYVPSLTPVGSVGESATFDAHARQSRFFFKTATLLDNGKKISGTLEFDMMSTSGGDERITNGYSPEIRHAFLSYENWLMGQTWSTFMDVASLPDSLDFIGNTDGSIFVRQAQVRYTHGGWQVALENPETTVTPNTGGTRIVTDDNSVPDLVVKYNHTAAWGSLAIALMARQLSIESATLDDSTNGYAASFSGKYTISATDDIRFTINSGKGIGRYIGLNTSNDAVLDATGQLEAIQATGYALAYKHSWDNKWRSSFIYSALDIDNEVNLTGLAVTDNTSSYAVNLIYQAASKLMFGVEVRHATREILSGADGDLNRVQFSVKYDF